MKDISIGGVIMLDRSTEVGVDEKEEVSSDSEFNFRAVSIFII